MNKLFKRIGLVLVGMAMAVGVGSAIGFLNKANNPALETKAENTPTTYTLNSASWGSANGNWTSVGDLDGTLASGKYGLNAGSAGAISPVSYSSISSFVFRGTSSKTGAGTCELFYSATATPSGTWTSLGSKSFATSLTWSISPAVSGYLKFTITWSKGNIYVSSLAVTHEAAPQKTLSSISVATPPAKTTYYAYEDFDPAGLVITRTYSDSTNDTYAYAGHSGDFSFSPSTNLMAGTSSITITYSGKTTTQSITTTARTLSSIAVTTPPTKTSYYVGDSFDPTGMVVAATYDVGPTKDVTGSCAFTPDPLTLETTAVTVSYGGKTTTQAVTVSQAPSVYTINFGSTKETNPDEIKTNADFTSTYTVPSGVTAGDFSKIYGESTTQLKCGSGSASSTISFIIPSSSYIVAVSVVVATAGGTSLDVTSGALGATTENQTIAVGTLTFDDNLLGERSNKVTLASTASGAFYLSSITISYFDFDPELHASSTSIEAAVNTSNRSINLTYDYFTPTSYTAVVQSGTSLTAGAVSFNTSATPHTATFTTGATTGATVFRITGSGSGKSAYVDVTVTVTEVRNLISLSITTASDVTAFKVGQTFDVGSLAITATFDSAPTSVVYSKANANLGALTFAPEIGYEFVEGDIGTITSVVAELEVGNGDEIVEYAITVSDKTYAAKISSASDLWDGQQIYFGDQEGTRVNVAHAGGNQLGSEAATVHATKGLSLDDVTNAVPYTVRREKIGSYTYYSFYYDGFYLKDLGDKDNNYIGRSATLDDSCRFSISVCDGEVTMTNKGNSTKPEFRWNSGSNWFSCYSSSSALAKATMYIRVAYSAATVANSFEESRLYMTEYTTNNGWCSDGEHAYYANAKAVWGAMTEDEKLSVSSDGIDRLEAWASANGDQLNGDMELVAKARAVESTIQVNVFDTENTLILLAVLFGFGAVSVGFVFIVRKRRQADE